MPGLGCFLQLAQDLGRDFRRPEFLVANAHADVVFSPTDNLVGDDLFLARDFIVPSAHEALDRVDGPLGIGNCLAPQANRRPADVTLVGERHDARGEPVSFLIGNDLGFFPLHHGNDRVGGSQIDTDNLFALSHLDFAP